MKRLVCIFRGHRWTIRVEDGDSYDVCSRCGKLPQSRAPGAEGFGGFYADERDGDLSQIRGDGGAGTSIGTGGL
ncbi:MAG: hypothetical protein ACJ744_01415 [Gaiellaceae bacterium]|jgi:hypothetical protein